MDKRIAGLDIFRGWAILLMIIFHLCYDLRMFRFIDADILHSPSWISFRALIVTMFLLAVGVSLYLVHASGINWGNLRKRLFYLGGAALIVTLGSYIEFPKSWVYFGILHFILLASFLILPFVKHPYFSLVTAVGILWGYAVGILHMEWLFKMLAPILHLPEYTRDLVSLFPWLAVVLLGVTLGGTGWYRPLFSASFFSEEHIGNRMLALMGRYALIIYLLHLPILFFLVEMLYKILHT
ncbi:MAG: DUF1624 domain-containing protein [Sulfurovum sp.]|nr:DUF1624 domain-containing protein [Sulfurovum sp.]